MLTMLRGEAVEVKPYPRFGYWLPGRGVIDEIAVSGKPARRRANPTNRARRPTLRTRIPLLP